MPRKTKDQDNLDEIKKEKKTSTKNKKASSSKKDLTKNSKSTKTSPSKTKTSNSKKTDSTTTKAKKTTKKATKTTRKTQTKTSTTKQKNKISIVEYYDLPYRYNQTIVKLLAQTPTTLFIYWDISDEDRNKLQKQYGNDFFETTKPVLIIYNDTLNYSFEVEINDFANSWYLHVSDSNCIYRVDLGRRPINDNINYNTNYIHITNSNKIDSPNDCILFDKNQKMVYFKDIKTNEVSSKNISNLSFIRNMGKVYNIYDLYKKIYKDENIEEIYNKSNPSSHTTSNLK